MSTFIWAPSSEFVSSSISSRQILTAHPQSFRGARDLAVCLKAPLDSLLVQASSGGSGETVRMRRSPEPSLLAYVISIKFTRCGPFHKFEVNVNFLSFNAILNLNLVHVFGLSQRFFSLSEIYLNVSLIR